ncbi:hypothetical protein XENOCAPTIV_009403 [Xenoophorus captivus]|uniref:Uncharacterized protein n=1 Tax=Xenoophorus captivus TaxID=1517983 RepID=A0ABV0QZE4_9TELE
MHVVIVERKKFFKPSSNKDMVRCERPSAMTDWGLEKTINTFTVQDYFLCWIKSKMLMEAIAPVVASFKRTTQINIYYIYVMIVSKFEFLSCPCFISLFTFSLSQSVLCYCVCVCVCVWVFPERLCWWVWTASGHLYPILAGAFLRSCRTSILRLMLHVEW